MLAKIVYGAGRLVGGLTGLAVIVAIFTPAGMRTPGTSSSAAVSWTIALAVVGVPAAVAIHEAGHALACLALGARIRAVYLGNGDSAWLRSTVRGVKVSLGNPYMGRVEHEIARSVRRGAFITAAGSLTNFIVAGALFAIGRPGNWGIVGLALIMAVVGVRGLLPYRARTGRLTDGANLLALLGGQFAAATRRRDASGWLPLDGMPSAMRLEYREMLLDRDGRLQRERTTRWLAAYYQRDTAAWLAVSVIGRALRREGRIAELLELHADLPTPTGPLANELASATHGLTWEVLLLPDLPAEAADLAVRRVEWVLDNAEFKPGYAGWSPDAVRHTLAVGKLRQGQFAEAVQLCQPILAQGTLDSASRATVLATIALARKALDQPYEEFLTEAVALAPTADLVPEASGMSQFQTS